MVIKFILDTNVAIDFLGGRTTEPLPDGRYGISVISEIELLSFPSLFMEEEKAIRSLLDSVESLPLNEAVRDRTIVVRRASGLKLPDAVIVATAMTWESTLITNDKRLLHVPGLLVRTLHVVR